MVEYCGNKMKAFILGQTGCFSWLKVSICSFSLIMVEKMFQVNTEQLCFVFQMNWKIHYAHSCTCNISATLLLRPPMELSAKHKIEDRLNSIFLVFLALVEMKVRHTSQSNLKLPLDPTQEFYKLLLWRLCVERLLVKLKISPLIPSHISIS